MEHHENTGRKAEEQKDVAQLSELPPRALDEKKADDVKGGADTPTESLSLNFTKVKY